MKFKSILLDDSQPAGPWRWFRAVAIGFAIAFVMLFGWAAWVNFTSARSIDFVSFWAAARLASEGHSALAYDVQAHRQMELSVVAIDGLLPFPYPPPFLLLLLPFGLPPFWLAFILWVVATAAFYALASRAIAPLPYALGHPAAFMNALIGQNGFVTCGIFMLGAAQLSNSPFLAGAIWGLLVIKPQLALLLPFALAAGREWKAIAGGAVSAAAVTLLAFPLVGAEGYRAFFRILPSYAGWLSESRWPWAELASPFALMRYFGAPAPAALAVHSAIALIATLVTLRGWALRTPQRIPVLAAATLLISPYTFTYDSLLLVVPLAWLTKGGRQPWAVAFIWLCCLLPILGFDGPYTGPNTVSLAALVSLWAVHREVPTTARLATGLDG